MVQRKRLCLVAVVLGAAFVLPAVALAGHCGPGGGCSADMDGDGIIGLPDAVIFQSLCINGGDPNDERCDVNCDGQFSGCDIEIATQIFFIGVDDPSICANTICGACCEDTPGVRPTCSVTTPDQCANAGGDYQGDGTMCANVVVVNVVEPGGEIFTHVVEGVSACPESSGAALRAPAEPTAPPYIDGWTTSPGQCHQFGVAPESPPIPADFFDPGSDPFVGQVCLQGEPLGGPFQILDTIIERERDPFSRCELPGANEETVMIEIVELSLRGIDPITVTYDGGGSPEQWDVQVDLSDAPSPPGTLTATKTHCNGGTYVSTLPVRPRFTFTLVGNPGEVRVLDTGLEGIPPIVLDQPNPQPWATDIGIFDDPIIPQTSHFHPGFQAGTQGTECDGDENGIHDECQTLAARDPGTVVPPLQASPNPFRSKTTVQFALDTDAEAGVTVYDMAGRRVRVLLEAPLKAGAYAVDWNGQDAQGRDVPAGIYLVRVEAGSFVREGKVLRIQ